LPSLVLAPDVADGTTKQHHHRLAVAAMLLMMTSWLVSGLPRQFMLPLNNMGADLAGQITTFPGAKLARVSPTILSAHPARVAARR
jgi:hypothetical protein